MKNKILVAALLMVGLAWQDVAAERLVILHTNDTHSQIDPTDKNLGGILRRKVLVDSVRAVEPNVLLVDAGDAVQGSLYFSLFGGEVERKLMNAFGYDMAILGNHEFDNGVERLAEQYSKLDATKLSSNYDMRGTPLEGMFEPYKIVEVGGRKIGFIAINLDPKGMIADKNSVGIKYIDGLAAANAMSWYLKNIKHADMVVALTHIGYHSNPGYSDVDLAHGTKDIDVIIGGHSHTTVDPASEKSPQWLVDNADGRKIIVAQTGKSGVNIGEIDIDLDNLTADYKLIKVDKRLDITTDPMIAAIIEPYRHGVDSIRGIVIGRTPVELSSSEPALLNLVSDYVLHDARKLVPNADLSIMNKGGIRCSMPQGKVTQGLIMQMLPFDNRIVVLELPGESLLRAFEVMASRGGDGVSRNVDVVYSADTHKIISAKVNGKPIDSNKIYRVATIDYLAGGGDYMVPLTTGKRVAEGDGTLYDGLIDYFRHGPLKGKAVKPDNKARMRSDK